MNTFDALNVGTPVSLIWYENGEPQSIIATVCMDQPLTVEVGEVVGNRIRTGDQFKVLFQKEGAFETANAEVATISKFGTRFRYELTSLEWVKSDRRSFERHVATILTKCRFVSEEPTGVHIREFTVTTKDISLGGAWVQSDSCPASGTILNCELSTEPNSVVKTLAVVAWADPNGRGFGVEFLDYIGASRTTLENYISKLAA